MASVLALSATAAGAAGPDDEIVVRYRGGAPRAALSADGRRTLETASTTDGAVVRLAVPAGSGERQLAALRAQPGVAWAAPNRRMQRLWTIDPSAEPERAGQWHLDQVRADLAWAFTRGDPAVKVAVVDSGIDADHPDRPANLIVGPSFAGAPLGDRDGHGTLVAGTIASPINRLGTVGVAPEATVMSLKVDDAEGAIRVFDVYQAIVWAADNGANIVNVSLGLPEDSPPLREAVEYARARNVLVVAAAGNSGGDGNPVIYPAGYAGVLAVGATTADGQRAPYSQAGPQISLVAPGGSGGEGYPGGVLGPMPGGGSGRIAGTSVAAPIVSAAAALVWSADRSLTAEQVRRRLEDSAADVGVPGRDPETGAGLVDVGRAVREAAAATPYRALLRGQECPTIVAAGGRSSMVIDITNAGGRTWTRSGAGAVHVATARPDGRLSPFYLGALWPSETRAAGLAVESVVPGGTARFVVPLQAPGQTGVYREYFRVAGEGVGTLLDPGIYCDVQVVPSTPWLAADAEVLAPRRMAPGTRARVTATVRNVGTAAWSGRGATPIRLGTAGPHDRPSALHDPLTWLSANRVTAAIEGAVAPGERATFELDVVAPAREGTYREVFAPVIDGVSWLNHEVVVTIEVAR